MVTHDDTIDKTRIHVSPDKVRAAMHTRNVTTTELAIRMGLSLPAVSRGLKSQHWLLAKLPTLVEKLHVAKRTLLASEDSPAGGPVMLTRVCGAPRDGGYVLPANCEVRRVVHGDQAAWLRASMISGR